MHQRIMASTAFATVVTASMAQGPSAEWTAVYDGGAGNDAPTAMALGPARVHVAGYASGAATGPDFVTITYDAGGDELWCATYDGPAHEFDQVVALAADDAGGVVVTGISTGLEPGIFDYATIRYDPDGGEIWIARFDGPGESYDSARALAVDPTGHVYVTGSSSTLALYSNYVTIKYDPAGTQLWLAEYDAPGVLTDEDPSAIAVDAAGNVYVTGNSEGTVTASGFDLEEDIATVKYDPDGNELWLRRYESPGHGLDRASGLALDADANVYVAGDSAFPDPAREVVVVKYDTDGNQLWIVTHPLGVVGGTRAMSLDASGHVYVAAVGASEVDTVYVTLRIDAAGNLLWSAVYDFPGFSLEQATALDVDAASNVYVTGISQIIDGVGFATVKYDAAGSETWSMRCPGVSARGIAVDDFGKLYVTGMSDGGDIVTIKYGQCAGDVNGDGTIGVADLVAVILAWGTGDPAADVSGDGIVGVIDVGTVIANWGSCRP